MVMIQIQRTVLIQRDERGFGLRVSGDKPVYVESVKQGECKTRSIVQCFDFASLFAPIDCRQANCFWWRGVIGRPRCFEDEPVRW